MSIVNILLYFVGGYKTKDGLPVVLDNGIDKLRFKLKVSVGVKRLLNG